VGSRRRPGAGGCRLISFNSGVAALPFTLLAVRNSGTRGVRMRKLLMAAAVVVSLLGAVALATSLVNLSF
jgi:hypothetical protein